MLKVTRGRLDPEVQDEDSGEDRQAAITQQISAVLYGLAAIVFVLLTVRLTVDAGPPVTEGQWYLAANFALLAAVILDRMAGALSLMCAFFFSFFIALPALVQIQANSFPFASHYDQQQLVSGYLVLSIAQAAQSAGHAIARSAHRQRRRIRRSASGRDAPASRMRDGRYLRLPVARRLYLTISIAVLLLGFALGPQILLRTRSELGTVSDDGLSNQLLLIGRSASLFALLLMCVAARARRAVRDTQIELFDVTIVILAFAAFHYPPSLSRFELLGSVLAVLSIFVNFHLLGTKLLFGLMAPLFLFFAFPAIKSIGSQGSFEWTEARSSSGVHEYLLRVDFDAYKQVVDSTIYLNYGGDYRFGENFLGSFLFWVPRSIWPGKPVNSGELVSKALGFPYTNVSNPLPSEALLSFGLAGVAVVFVLIGYLVFRIETRSQAASLELGVSLDTVLYAISAGFATIVLRGALNSVAPFFGTAILLTLAAGMVAGRTRDPPSRSRV